MAFSTGGGFQSDRPLIDHFSDQGMRSAAKFLKNTLNRVAGYSSEYNHFVDLIEGAVNHDREAVKKMPVNDLEKVFIYFPDFPEIPFAFHKYSDKLSYAGSSDMKLLIMLGILASKDD